MAIVSRGFLLFLVLSHLPEGRAQTPGATFSEDLKTKAEGGDAQAQFQLGNCYFFGLGVPKKQIDGVGWYRKAAEQGHAEAQFNLGVVFIRGMGPNRTSRRRSAGGASRPAKTFLRL